MNDSFTSSLSSILIVLWSMGIFMVGTLLSTFYGYHSNRDSIYWNTSIISEPEKQFIELGVYDKTDGSTSKAVRTIIEYDCCQYLVLQTPISIGIAHLGTCSNHILDNQNVADEDNTKLPLLRTEESK